MTGSPPSTIAAIADAVEQLLTVGGPLSHEQLLAALVDAGVELGGDPVGTLEDVLDSEDLPLVLPLTDGRHVFLPGLLAGRVFTHRVAAAEIAYDLLAISPDLEPLSMLTESDRYRHLVDGVELVDIHPLFDSELIADRGIPIEEVPESGAFLLWQGHLRAMGLSSGDLVGVCAGAAGFEIERVDETAVCSDLPAGLGERLLAILSARPDPQGPEPLDSVVWTACAGDPDLFLTPLPPLGQVLDAAGLVSDGEQIAPAGFDFGAWRAGQQILSIQQLHGLGDDEALAVLAMVTLYDQIAELYDAAVTAQAEGDLPAPEDLYAALGLFAAAGPDTEVAGTGVSAGHASADLGGDPAGRILVRATSAFLADPAVAVAVLAETIGTGRDGAAPLGLFAETLEVMAPRSARAALRWMRAKAHERLGEILEAEAGFGAAQSLDPAWPPALFDLARYASDRGDAPRALALLHRAGARSDDGLLVLLEHFQPKARTDIRRNQLCWCGSGRKYKKCHLNHEDLPLAERAAWLYQKAGTYLLDGPWGSDVLAVAQQRARYWDIPNALLAACDDPLVADAVLFEGGGFAEFLAERGILLPVDERLLAEQWLLVDRSVYEVEAVRPGQGFTVRDLRTGDRHDVREATASRQLQAGMLLCARFVSAGDTTQCFGGIEPVGLHQRDELIDLLDTAPDPTELVAFLSRRYAPPQLQNTEGDALVLCEATLRVPDPARLMSAFDETYDRADPDADPTASKDVRDHDGPTAQWIEHVTTHGMQRIRATLRLTGDELQIETNSEARLERLLDAVRLLQPAVTVIAESRQPASDAIRRAGHQPPGGEAAENPFDSTDPDVVALLEQMARQFEQAWLDDEIPALAGNTPRQAAADPTRRGDLIRLLDSFPSAEGRPGSMDPDRLRAALGLQ